MDTTARTNTHKRERGQSTQRLLRMAGWLACWLAGWWVGLLSYLVVEALLGHAAWSPAHEQPGPQALHLHQAHEAETAAEAGSMGPDIRQGAIERVSSSLPMDQPIACLSV